MSVMFFFYHNIEVNDENDDVDDEETTGWQWQQVRRGA